MTADLVLVTSAERPDLRPDMLALGDSPWPEFLNHDAVTNEFWPLLHELAPDYQFALLDGPTKQIAAIGNCIPIRWDGNPDSLPDDGIDAVLRDGTKLLREGAEPTAASALMIVVRPEWLGRGISARALSAMAEIVGRHGLRDLVAPVRPTDKHRYPLIEMARYITWRRDDGTAFDPWIRVHERIGGRVVRAAASAMRVTGTVAQWESWTGMSLPDSGSYVVTGGLVPVRIDRDRDIGEYVEPACWVRHRTRI